MRIQRDLERLKHMSQLHNWWNLVYMLFDKKLVSIVLDVLSLILEEDI